MRRLVARVLFSSHRSPTSAGAAPMPPICHKTVMSRHGKRNGVESSKGQSAGIGPGRLILLILGPDRTRAVDAGVRLASPPPPASNSRPPHTQNPSHNQNPSDNQNPSHNQNDDPA